MRFLYVVLGLCYERKVRGRFLYEQVVYRTTLKCVTHYSCKYLYTGITEKMFVSGLKTRIIFELNYQRFAKSSLYLIFIQMYSHPINEIYRFHNFLIKSSLLICNHTLSP